MFRLSKVYVLLSDGAGDVTEYHVLRRQRSHVFLTLRFAQREDRGGTPFIRGLCSAQAGEQDSCRVDDGGRCEMSNMWQVKDMATAGNEGCGTRTDRYFCKNMCSP